MARTAEDSPRIPASQLWQLPVLLLALGLMGLGLYLAAPTREQNDYPGALDDAGALVMAGRYDEAISRLDGVLPHLHEVNGTLQRQYYAIRGDALSLGQRQAGWDKPVNHKLVIEAYDKASQIGTVLASPLGLEPPRLERLAESLVAVGEQGRAMELLAGLTGTEAIRRHRLMQRIIEIMLESARETGEDDDAIHKWIGRLLAEPGLARESELWAVARQADLLLRRGRHDETIDLLLMRLARLQDGGTQDLGALHVLLGKAYLSLGQPAEAERSFLTARQMMKSDDPAHGDALVGLAHIRFGEDNIAEAKGLFDDAVTSFPRSVSYIDALIGRAETQSRLGQVNESLADYEMVIGLLEGRPRRDIERVRRLAGSLEAQHDLRFGTGEYETALKYLQLESRLFGDEPPVTLPGRLGMTHEFVARQMMGLGDDEAETPAAWNRLDAARRAMVLVHIEQAADEYYAQSRLAGADDLEGHGQSLWKAADLYDRAGLHKQAIEVFSQFVKAYPGDAKTLEARLRLAKAHHADGQFEIAVKLYEQLIDEHPKSPQAYASLVPLARAYMARGPMYVDRAEHVLLTVVTDHAALLPESNEYRHALKELARLHYQRGGEGDFERAIERFTEVVERYPNDDDAAEMRFQLADAYRKSVAQIEQKLNEPLSPSQRAALSAQRARRLEAAKTEFEKVIELYEADANRVMSQLQALYHRNSYFYRADCAYDLGRYEGGDGAIALYTKAVSRFEKDPAVLVALIQIVNSYSELGQFDKARAANERAKWHLKQIPESAFDDPNLPMKRQHWQRWLDWTSQLALHDPSAKAGGPNN